MDNAEFDLFTEDYETAVKKIKKCYSADTSNAYINYKVGYFYQKTLNDKAKSLFYLRKAVYDISPNYPDGGFDLRKAPIKSWILLGDAYSLNYQFDQAIFCYQRYLKVSNTTNKTVLCELNQKIESAAFAKKLYSSPVRMEKELVCPDFDMGFDNKNPVISADESNIVFTTEETEAQQVYFSHKKGDKNNNIWSKPDDITSVFKSEGDFSSVYLSPDGNTLLISKTNKKQTALYESSFNGKRWTKALWLNENINVSNQKSACLSADGNTIYFSSDRQGGKGGYDIYKSVKNAGGQWTPAVNLGDKINTPYDDLYPFILVDNRTLFFSSQGHRNMGGYDIFFSKMKDNGEWSEPLNLGYPLNTPDDEMFYFPLKDGLTGYISLKPDNKTEEAAGRQIYKVMITPLDSAVFSQKLTNPIKAKEDPAAMDTISAERLHELHMKDTSVVTILVKETHNPEISGYLKEVKGMRVYNKDQTYRYYFGLYYNMDTAAADIKRFIDMGFKSAEMKNASKENFFNQSSPVADKIKDLTEVRKSVKPDEVKTEPLNKDAGNKDKVKKKQKTLLTGRQENIPAENTQNTKKFFHDEVTVPAYTIQVCATKNPTGDYRFFKDLKNVRENKCTDGWFRYTSGDFSDYETAKKELQHILAEGFKGAYVISYRDYRAKYLNGQATSANVRLFNPDTEAGYEIQICSSRKPVSNWEKTDNAIKIKKYDCSDGWYRYTCGEYPAYPDAKSQVPVIQNMGFKGAFVISVQVFKDKYLGGNTSGKTRMLENKTGTVKTNFKKTAGNKKKKRIR
ncbi:MAG: PD40 domain-containing protein [Bacteroidia bacterium]|nr:PD40 domain-containing protein [Bacteroidia bacterium]